ncbi:aminotransferase class III-fold pyridoxal phosphate-dependent enzyme [Maribacter forsetii]|uniref:aminotransferase class III-fold pyridoxal phosphate-dependent enzyme n=1 Tax=Maribacter forsetii TaxID=444515 RepID=UPI00056AB9FA|nr:aminotransferase class III-fold pyridoxal phosphate-dependent enzyme [Maribacter forsetii]
MTDVNSFLEKEFDLTIIDYKQLAGYDNLNYRITTTNCTYIYKTYQYSEVTFDMVKAENDTLLFLQNDFEKEIPKPIPFKGGTYVKTFSNNEKPTICRMLSFLEGDFLGDVLLNKQIAESLGAFLAKLDLKLKGFKNYTIQSRQWEWDLQYFHLNRKHINEITNATDRNIVRYFFNQFEENVKPLFPELRKQIIHNDANEWNVLVQHNKVTGIIDFGDLAHSFLINELAIAITYTCYDKENPLEWAVLLLKAYHQKLPLEAKEISILYYLIAARLCTSVCNSAHAKKVNPDNVYAYVSEQSAWKMLYHWLAINPIHAENEFRKAANFPIKKFDTIPSLLKRRFKHISPILSTSYKEPIQMVKSAFQYMYDAEGNTFLDAYNNIPHVGHSHPKVVEAAQHQLAKLNTNTRYIYDELADYAEKLLEHFPSQLNKVFFVNSGSAASDLAIRLANNHTRSNTMMVMESGYHGNTQLAIDISDYKFNNSKGQGQKSHIIKATLPDTYRGKYNANDPNAGTLYGKDAVAQINQSKHPISAFISEPILGCAGQVPLADGYLKEVYPAIRAQGGVCISDEVQTGFGRLGDHFWGYEAHGVIPDIVILGKPIANGHPMGAVVCTEEIAKSFEKGVEFFSSFGGNPVSCVIASAVLDVIAEEKLQEKAKIVGDYYMALLKDLMQKYSCIGNVRGSGLFIGFEIVKDNTKTPNTTLASHIKNELRNKHILVSTDGPFNNVIKTKPPLCFSKKDAENVVMTVNEILEKYYSIGA